MKSARASPCSAIKCGRTSIKNSQNWTCSARTLATAGLNRFTRFFRAKIRRNCGNRYTLRNSRRSRRRGTNLKCQNRAKGGSTGTKRIAPTSASLPTYWGYRNFYRWTGDRVCGYTDAIFTFFRSTSQCFDVF